MKIELHHIIPGADGGGDGLDNCIPLCFDCHAEVQHYNVSHPRGRKFTPSELRSHRDSWFTKQQTVVISRELEYHELDRQLLSAIRDLLPPTGGMAFLRAQSLNNVIFAWDDLGDLQRFVDQSVGNPEFEFLDADLEGLRADLTSAIVDFIDFLQIHSMRYPSDPRVGIIGTDTMVTSGLLNRGQRAWKTYESLLKIGRRRLPP